MRKILGIASRVFDESGKPVGLGNGSVSAAIRSTGIYHRCKYGLTEKVTKPASNDGEMVGQGWHRPQSPGLLYDMSETTERQTIVVDRRCGGKIIDSREQVITARKWKDF